jgi:hypothetical protein
MVTIRNCRVILISPCQSGSIFTLNCKERVTRCDVHNTAGLSRAATFSPHAFCSQISVGKHVAHCLSEPDVRSRLALPPWQQLSLEMQQVPKLFVCLRATASYGFGTHRITVCPEFGGWILFFPYFFFTRTWIWQSQQYAPGLRDFIVNVGRTG